jgi:hypothetical protein
MSLTPRIGGAVVVIVLAAGLLAGVSAAQTFSGNQSLSPVCGTNTFGPIGGPASEEQVRTTSCNFICSVPPGQGVGSHNEARWARCAQPGFLASSTRVWGQQLTSAPCGTGAGGGSSVQQIMTASDVVFTNTANPGATGFISVTLNLEFRGHVSVGPSCTGPAANITICGGVTGSCNAGGSFYGTLLSGVGVLAGYANDGSMVSLVSNAVTTQLVAPQPFYLELVTACGVGLCESFNPTTTSAVAEALLSLPASGPVFNLPAGITCNSAQLGIVDNQWVQSGQASVTSIGSGCNASGGQPLALGAVGDPSVGNGAFALAMTGLPSGSSGTVYLALGLAPAPLVLGGGCQVYLDLASATALISAGLSPLGPVPESGGAAAFPLPIPLLPVAFGLIFAAQGVCFDPGVPGGIATTNALSMVVGS